MEGGVYRMETIVILEVQFERYPLETTTFKDVAGVYVISTSQKWVDVGETDKLGSRLANHERRPCWKRNCDNLTLCVNFRQIGNQQERLDLEAKLRSKLNPSCGEQ